MGTEANEQSVEAAAPSGIHAEPNELEPIHSPAKRMVAYTLIAAALVVVVGVAAFVLNRVRIASEDEFVDICMPSTDTSGIDWPDFHRRLLPEAFVHEGAESREAALAALSGAEREGELIGEFLNTTAAPGDADAHLRASQLVDEWNALMWERGVPWRIALPMDPRFLAEGPLALSYCVVAAAEATIENSDVIPVFVVSRQDSILIRESYAGHAGEVEQAAIILSERVADIAWNMVWPALATPDEASKPYETALHTLVVSELESLLGAETLAVLRETADARRNIVRFRDVTTERNACGGGMQFNSIPLRGFSDAEIVQFRDIATPDHAGGCPALTISEFEMVRAASAALRGRAGLRAATDALTALVARSVAVHEARHVADVRLEAGRPCSGCAQIPERAHTELSAYAASFTAGPIPLTEVLIACGMLDRGAGGAHGTALVSLLRAMGDDVCSAATDGLAANARAAEQAIYGTATAIVWQSELPASLGVEAF